MISQQTLVSFSSWPQILWVFYDTQKDGHITRIIAYIYVLNFVYNIIWAAFSQTWATSSITFPEWTAKKVSLLLVCPTHWRLVAESVTVIQWSSHISCTKAPLVALDERLYHRLCCQPVSLFVLIQWNIMPWGWTGELCLFLVFAPWFLGMIQLT